MGQPESFTISLKTKKDDAGTRVSLSNEKAATGAQPTDSAANVKLRPVGKKSVTANQGGDVNQYLDELSNMLQDMKLKPTKLESVSKQKDITEDDKKVIEKAVKTSQKVLQQTAPSKTTGKLKQAEVFVDTLVNEIPTNMLPDSLDKQAITRKVSLIPSLDTLSATEEKKKKKKKKKSTCVDTTA